MKFRYLACSTLAATLSAGLAQAAAPAVTVNGGGSSLAYPDYSSVFSAYSASKKGALFSYEAVGSGGGQNAFLTNNIAYFEPLSASNPLGYAPGTLTYGAIVGTQVDFGASDAFLTASQLTNPATGSYANSAADGPLIQVPTLGVPITLAYNESGTSLTLTDAQLCGVLSGEITDWHTLNSSIAAGTTIKVAVRSDGSGTTFLLTQHLGQVCNSGNSAFPVYPVPTTKYFYNSSTKASNEVFPNGLPANFTGESGSGGVAGQLVATANSIGYLSPDYTSIAPSSPNTTSLQVASLVNAVDGKTYSPSIANTTLGLANPGTGSTNPTPPASLSAAQDPLNWVPAIPQTSKGYPIVGYTTVDVSSCYSSAARGKLVIAVLKDFYAKSGAYGKLTANNGFVPLVNSGAAKFYTAVSSTFLSNKSKYNLDIDDATTCASYTGR